MKPIAIPLLLLLLGVKLQAYAQHPADTTANETLLTSPAPLQGNLKDERGHPIVNAYVECSEGGIVRAREVTDFDGNYTLRPLRPGIMTVTFKFQGKELVVTDIAVAAGIVRTVNGTLRTACRPESVSRVRYSCVRKCLPPLIDPSAPGGRTVHTGDGL